MKTMHYFSLIIAFFFLIIVMISVVAESQVIVDFYYSETCGSCRPAIEVMDNVTIHYERNFSGKVIINKKDVGANATNREEMRTRKLSYPSVIINNETRIPRANITFTDVTERIDEYIKNLKITKTYNENVIHIPLIGTVNLTTLSLPLLTVILAGLDSFNPCSFFILIFLLNLLVYLPSRKRMLLVGGIFIFFSGLFYFLFMFVMFNTLLITASFVSFISIAVGLVAVSIGLLNMKDFFFLKKGLSLSIPKEKRVKIFHRMRKLIKSPSLIGMLGATIFLAISVNFYELLCTLGFPMIFTARLIEANLSTAEYYLYLFFYNVVYIIPLFVILILVTYTLGKTKLTEHQSGILKLLSGIMIFSFGIFFIIDYTLLENLITPIALLGLSIILAFLVSLLWKHYQNKMEKQQDSQSDKKNIE